MKVAITFAALAVLVALVPLGCAKSPTAIGIDIAADPSLPAIPILQFKATLVADPSMPVTARYYRSGSAGTADGGPPTFSFPTFMSIGVYESWTGPVEVLVEGRLWDSANNTEGAVVGTGTARADVVPNETVKASVMLTSAPPPAISAPL